MEFADNEVKPEESEIEKQIPHETGSAFTTLEDKLKETKLEQENNPNDDNVPKITTESTKQTLDPALSYTEITGGEQQLSKSESSKKELNPDNCEVVAGTSALESDNVEPRPTGLLESAVDQLEADFEKNHDVERGCGGEAETGAGQATEGGLQNQLFILSSAGKPIYSLSGDEEGRAGLCGVVQALVSVCARGGDALRSVRAGDTRVVFLTRGPLILVAACTRGSPESLLTLQLTCALEQVISVLTMTQLSLVLERRRNYDLRRLLGGAERLVGAGAARAADPAAVVGGVRALPLPSAVRDQAAAALAAALASLPHAVFGVLVAEERVAAAARRRKYPLLAADLLVLLNLVHATDSFRSAETWTPVCLPRFDSTGFLHAHVSYVSDRACLLLLSVQRDAFFQLSEARRRVADTLRSSGALHAIDTAPLDVPHLAGDDVERFVYVCTESRSVVSAGWGPGRVRELARAVHAAHAPRAAKLLYTRTHTHTLLAWVTSNFEMYAWLTAWPDKAACIVSVDRTLRRLRKQQDTLLLPPAHTF